MRDYTVENPVFSDKIRIVEEEDLVNAENDSAAAKQLLGNDLALAARMDKVLGNDDNNGDPGFVEGLDAKNVIDAINKLFLQGNENKQTLVDNLIAMGIQASTDDTWGTLLDKVLDMTDTSNDTVTAATLLAGYTAHNASGELITGIMPNKGAWTANTTGNSNVSIPAGYHNGQGYISGAGAYSKGVVDADARTNTNSANYKSGYNAGVAATKKGTAGTGDVLAGKTFTNAGSVGAAGTMANRGAWTANTTGNSNVTIPAGYHNGSGYVSGAGAYNKGVSDADGRPNVNSANYKAGYNAGMNAVNVSNITKVFLRGDLGFTPQPVLKEDRTNYQFIIGKKYVIFLCRKSEGNNQLGYADGINISHSVVRDNSAGIDGHAAAISVLAGTATATIVKMVNEDNAGYGFVVQLG